jgi:hypothetical protein
MYKTVDHIGCQYRIIVEAHKFVPTQALGAIGTTELKTILKYRW